MRVVIAPDSFKEALDAVGVAEALAEGWLRARPEDEVDLLPMADGGEGTVDALVRATGGTRCTVQAPGPLNTPVEAFYGLLEDGATAVIEMAAASGLPLVPVEARNPCLTTTLGTGALVRHALEAGVKRIILGVGGSATNDGGAGFAQALGYRFLDSSGQDLPSGGAALADLDRIDAGEKHAGLADCAIRVACDVDNPLCGPQGASSIYGPQKGATPDQVTQLDAALAHFATVVNRDLGMDIRDVPGAGAAGGLGGGAIAFAGATLTPGVALVAEACGLATRIAGADLVITGEGRLDPQSLRGKTPMGVARLARDAGVPVLAVSGAVFGTIEAFAEAGLGAVFSITPHPMDLSEALAQTRENLLRTAESLARAWSMGHG
jgi:glycerate 2-kinase